MQLKIHAPFSGQSGYERLTRGIAIALDKIGVQVQLFPYNDWNDEWCDIDFEDRTRLERMARQQVSQDAPVIMAQFPKPEYHNFYQQSKLKICFTLFETDRFPNYWKHCFATLNLDRIWTFSEFNRSYWIKDGLPASIIDVMPFGIDSEMFSPDGEKAEIQNRKKFMFLTNGDFTERKNFEGLIEAYVTEFTDKDDVCLVVKTHYGGFTRPHKDKCLQRLRDIALRFNPSSPPLILFCGDKLADFDMPLLYRAADCYITSTRGEGLCTLPNANIKTVEGIKEIKDITIKDKVFSHTGRICNVLKTFKRHYIGKMIRIKCYGRNNQAITLTPNHEVRAIRTSDLGSDAFAKLRNNCEYNSKQDILIHCHKNSAHYKNQYTKYNLEWIKAEHLKKGDMIFYPKLRYEEKLEIIDLKEIKEISDNNYIYDGKIYKRGRNQFMAYNTNHVSLGKDIILITNDLMKLFGYYVAEGCSTKDGSILFSFNSNELEYHEEVKNLMLTCFSVTYCKVKKHENKNCTLLNFNNKVVARLLLYLFGHKARNKKIPNWFFNLSDDKKTSFLHGLFNGDGYYKDKLSLTTASVNLANNVFDLLQSMGIGSSIKKRIINDEKTKGEKEYYSVLITNIKNHNSLIDIFGKKEFSLISKKHQQKFITRRDFQLLQISEIECLDYEGEVNNIWVDTDNSYICENLAVHNCMPIIESLSCGVPVIATNWSGYTDFINEKNGWLVPCTIGVIDDTEYIKKCLVALNHSWAYPDMTCLKSYMRYAYMNPDICKEKGRQGREDMLKKDWQAVSLFIVKKIMEMTK